ncbi:GDSL-type esterase/lipase family protein [Dyadobacter tibetensis]|uniref:GDSL-type esterase/lipase family protein n=1 Tax=Dyadobacter tibetensis TaxID=1211851 RepID=UPI0004725482|nr:GDSL-type esterase/lipase family protein [Dyadobacter tibetensis]
MEWYEEEVKRVLAVQEIIIDRPSTIFYGSSSITLWSTLGEDFKSLNAVNFGFGGSTLAACAWFFPRLFTSGMALQRLVLYAGDNDLGDGRNPEEVFLFYTQLMYQVRQKFGNIPCYFISIKPSFSRWEIIGRIKTANKLIRNEISQDPFQHYVDIYPAMLNEQGIPARHLYEPDGLHISAAGYDLWKREVRQAILLAENLGNI